MNVTDAEVRNHSDLGYYCFLSYYSLYSLGCLDDAVDSVRLVHVIIKSSIAAQILMKCGTNVMPLETAPKSSYQHDRCSHLWHGRRYDIPPYADMLWCHHSCTTISLDITDTVVMIVIFVILVADLMT
jgi:hypothetical protein